MDRITHDSALPPDLHPSHPPRRATKVNRMAETDTVILAHATLTALTPLIPVPFVDTAIQNRIMRRMVRSLAETHHVRIGDNDVKTLVDDEGGKFFRGVAKSVVLAPFKFILKKTFMVLAGKYIVDLASASYHRGFLIDRAFHNGWCVPRGKVSPEALRRAIDTVMQSVPIVSSPVTRALRLGFESSQRLLLDAYHALKARLASGSIDNAIADAADSDGGLGGVIASLMQALTEVPRAHFDDLEAKLKRELFGDAAGDAIVVNEVEAT
jgi:hypothetical protein